MYLFEVMVAIFKNGSHIEFLQWLIGFLRKAIPNLGSEQSNMNNLTPRTLGYIICAQVLAKSYISI